MTRIDGLTSFAGTRYGLQPNSFLGDKRIKAFIGNHPTNRHQRVNFIRSNDVHGGSSDGDKTITKIYIELLTESKSEMEKAESTLRLDFADGDDKKEVLTTLKKTLNDPSLMVKTASALSILQIAIDRNDISSLTNDIGKLFDSEKKEDKSLTPLSFLLAYAFAQQTYNENGISETGLDCYIENITKKIPSILTNINEALQNGTEAEKELSSFYLRCLSKLVSINDSIESLIDTIKSDNPFIGKNCLKALRCQIAIDPQSIAKKNNIETALNDIYNNNNTNIKEQIIDVLNELAREKILKQEGIPILLKALNTNEKDEIITINFSLLVLKKAHDNGLDISSVREKLVELTESNFPPIKRAAKELLKKIRSGEN